jgi:hypothetical protein
MEVSGQLHFPAVLPPGKEIPVPIGQVAVWAQEPVWMRCRKEKFVNDKTTEWILDFNYLGYNMGSHKHSVTNINLHEFQNQCDAIRGILGKVQKGTA